MTDTTFNALHPSVKRLVLLLNNNRLEEYYDLVKYWWPIDKMLNRVRRAMDRVDDDVVWFESRYEVHPELEKSRRLFMQLNKIRVNLEKNRVPKQNESGSDQEQNSLSS